MLSENVENIRQNVYNACKKAHRDTNEVTVIAVTKSVGVKKTEEVLEQGFLNLGENRADVFLEKKAAIDMKYRPVWHFIGNLQRRKVKKLSTRLIIFMH